MTRRALAAGAVILSLGLAEVMLRAFDWPRFDACVATADYAVTDPELGFYGGPYGEVAGVRLNADGWRGPPLTFPKPPDERRILFIGDSTCWGLGVDLDGTFAAQTAESAGARFLLGAFPGYSSYHSGIVLERLLPQDPDLVVLYVGARNDGTRARYFPDADIPSRRARLDAGWHRIRLLRLAEVAVDRSYRRLFRQLRSRKARARVPPDAFRSNVAAMLSRLEQAGVPALVVIPPLSSRFEQSEPQMQGYREILADVADERDVPTVSVDADFAAWRGEPLYFEDGFHLTARGHAIVAEAITSVLETR